MTAPAPDTFRPVASLYELPTTGGTILVLDRSNRDADRVAADVQELVKTAQDHLSDTQERPATRGDVFDEWWQLGFDSHLGHLSQMWNLHLLGPAQSLPQPPEPP